MTIYAIVLILHVLGATIWTGGHLVLSFCILPNALRTHSTDALLAFESRFERLGIPALITQIVTGIYLAMALAPPASWWEMDHPITRAIMIKLGLLGATALLAADARLRLIPNLTPEKLHDLAWHVIGVTLISVIFVVIGVGYRVGLLSW